MIRWTYAFVDRPLERFAVAHDFWARVSEATVSEPRGERGEFVTLLPEASGADACVKVQGVLDGPGGAHLDLAVDDVSGTGERARALGAAGVHTEPGLEVLCSPAGHLFCLVSWSGESAVPPPVGTGERVDQVCLDTPPQVYDRECTFWSALTEWPEVPCSRPEFRLVSGVPVQLLLQRLDANGPAGAHLDLACRDTAAARARHEKLGATHVSDGASWIVMRDPAGAVYCLTERTP
ncbi:VOC family protein [Streptomyces longispororuber]|uniref:VOC family protein n=1 Tax=Streptomyces longispororuber TaxID=68230 RepID=UPI00210D9C95|nr:VOC family protein [Streptomyces longispororuber]MCQ4214058.1 VOC family protein [Streptomyces longispororuber]